MNAGTGIFLGMSLLGVIALYVVTRDRWRWNKIIVRGVLSCVVLLFVVWAWLAATSAYSNRVRPMQTYQGLQFTDTRADVRFKKGEPDEASERVWVYAKGGQPLQIVILFKGDEIQAVFYSGTCKYCETLNGLNIGDSYDRVIERLGQPTNVSTSRDGLTRLFSFKDSNMVIRMTRGEVEALGIYNPTVGPPDFAQQ